MQSAASPQDSAQSGSFIFRTDLDGKLDMCNDAFAEACGYSRESLLGKPCSVLRHADTPDAIFTDLWESLHAARPWAGVLMNRRQDDEPLWLDLYIMRVFDGDQHVGYGAMARPASDVQVARAKRLYRQLLSSTRHLAIACDYLKSVALTAVCVAPVIALALAAGASPVLGALAALPLFALPLWSRWRQERDMRQLLQRVPSACISPLCARAYSDGNGVIALATLALHGFNARLHTALLRIGMAGKQVEASSMEYAARVQHDAELLDAQRAETDQAATAICQMAATVEEIGRHVQHTANSAGDAHALAERGLAMAAHNQESMHELSNAVQGIGEAIERLVDAGDSIGGMVDVINGIAEQTNLLALNAAIEAARAGDQGRGFAVVASEVRSLALRTQQSTEQVRLLIADLRSSTRQSVAVSARGVSLSEACAQEVDSLREALNGIVFSVGDISAMSHQMAVATEEQTQVVGDISRQIESIATLSTRNAGSAREGAQSSRLLLNQAEALRGLAQRFDR